MKLFQDIWLLNSVLFPLLDIFIVAYLIYKVYLIIAETRAIAVLKGLVLLLGTTVVARFFQLETLGWALENFMRVAAIALIVLFQPELRQVLIRMGQGRLIPQNYSDSSSIAMDELNAFLSKAKEEKIGALLVFEQKVGLRNLLDSGEVLNADLSYRLLMTVFDNKSPLHDGAMILNTTKVLGAACFLPPSAGKVRNNLGTRHRGAIGISEQSDAVVLIVSEETGAVSVARGGKLKYDLKPDQWLDVLLELYGKVKEPVSPDTRHWTRFFKRKQA